MQKKVKAYMIQNQMVQRGDRILLGISGGGDSVALLDVLCALSGEMGFEVFGIHIHHGIRGEEAERDLELVKNLCAQKGIELSVYRYEVPALAREWKVGLEEAGRRVRMEAFQKEAERLEEEGRSVRIALAHHQDDLAETVLHHLARGSGIRGLGSMRPVAENRIRPFLCLRRREIEQYLKEQHLSFATDSTNLEDAYTRNRIRHQLLPLLEQTVNEQAVAHMAETARMASLTEDYLSRKGRELLARCQKEERSILLDENFFQEEEILQSYGIREAFFCLTKEWRDFSAHHVHMIQELFGFQTGKQVMLPCNLVGKREYEGVRLIRAERKKEEKTEQEWELTVPGSLVCTLGTFEAQIFSWKNQKILEKKYTKWLDYDKIRYHLSVRTRKTGDFMVVDQKGSRKKLTRCMIDEKVPREERESLPLVVCEQEVLWMVGGRINERYKITSDTRRVLELKYQGGCKDE